MKDHSAEDRAGTSATAEASTPGPRLVYAAPVHTFSLIIAALAWSRIQGAIESVDSIVSRRGDTSLIVEGSASRLPDVPSEIWDLVKEHAKEDLYKAEEDSFFKWLHSEGPAPYDSDSENEADRNDPAPLKFTHMGRCERCRFSFWRELGGMLVFFKNCQEEMSKMLSYYGLEIACGHLVPGQTFDRSDVNLSFDGDTLVAVSGLETRAKPEPDQSIISVGFTTAPEPEAIAEQEPNLPTDANMRFARLFELVPERAEISDGQSGDNAGALAVSRTPDWKMLETARQR